MASAPPSPRLTFLAVGDWGRRGAEGQRAVAQGLARAAQRLGSAFVLTTGDNFYEHDLQHLERRGVHYVVSGAGAECRATGANADTCFSQAALGFAALTLTPGALHVQLATKMRACSTTRGGSGRKRAARPCSGKRSSRRKRLRYSACVIRKQSLHVRIGESVRKRFACSRRAPVAA